MSEKAEEKAGGGALEAELLRLRDELEKTLDGRRTLADIRAALAVMRTLGLSWERARLYVAGWEKG